jgi:hypothetical protein
MSIDPQDDRGKATKAEAQYGPGGKDHCGICRYFLELSPQRTVGACSKVRGPIRPQDWCRYYQFGTRAEGATRIAAVPPLNAAAAVEEP